jgi:hypothetical protein
MADRSSERPTKIPSPADYPLGSAESRAVARLMAGNVCEGHGYRTDAGAEAAMALHEQGLISCPFGSSGPFISLEGIPETDAVSG